MNQHDAAIFAFRCRVLSLSCLLALLTVLTAFYGSPVWALVLAGMLWAHSVFE